MTSKAKLLGHPIHPMLIVFPLGLLGTSVVFDIIYLATNDGKWTNIAEYMIGAGIICGLTAAVFGLVDWLGIPSGTRAKRIGAWHGIGNVLVVLLFAISFFMRYQAPAQTSSGAIVFSILGVLLALVTGWLGAEMVYRHGVGVESEDLNAHSSLSHEPGPGRRAA